MNVLVACEFSGRVRDAFAALGHYAVSCDILPSEVPGEHIQGDVRDVLDWGWDIMVAHPPCTFLATSGNRWLGRPGRAAAIEDALSFVRELLSAPIPRIGLENPRSLISSRIRPADQLIQPWMFGHGEVKATCLWLKGLPKLVPTAFVQGREARVHRMAPGPNRWRERSRTFTGVAAAMAAQWGSLGVEGAKPHLGGEVPRPGAGEGAWAEPLPPGEGQGCGARGGSLESFARGGSEKGRCSLAGAASAAREIEGGAA